MSVASRSGVPTCHSRIAPSSIGTMRSAISSWMQSTRSAEQRCPALSNADAITSATTCSGSAEESTTIAFCPPVSAISGIGRPRSSSRPARLRCSSRATSVDPVNITPRTRASATRRAPTTSPRPGRNCSASAGTPAACRRATAWAAISGVCSAGFASTLLPAASAAATCPVKIASGKFHGLMQTTGPNGAWSDSTSSARACAA